MTGRERAEDLASCGGSGPEVIEAFRRDVLARGRELYRDLPWRRTSDPYAVLVSEVMLQQTQVKRVDGRWQRWLSRFPSIDALAAADAADVLDEWQGMGYNRRALSLWRMAGQVRDQGGDVPTELEELVRLPGVGPATAAGVRAFAFDLPGVYLETNVRAVFLDAFFPGAEGVPDALVVPLVRDTCPPDASDPTCDPRTWYWALLDLGAHLKATTSNPTRRSKGYVRQSRFEGSHRQKRAALLRMLLDARDAGEGETTDALAAALSAAEQAAGRESVSTADALRLLEELAAEGFCRRAGDRWSV